MAEERRKNSRKSRARKREDKLHRDAKSEKREVSFVPDRNRKLKRDSQGKRICIVWDRAKAHKEKELRQALGGTLKCVHLINLPLYASDTDPIEHVWEKTKDQMSGKLKKGLEEVKNEFHSFITSSNFNYKI